MPTGIIWNKVWFMAERLSAPPLIMTEGALQSNRHCGAGFPACHHQHFKGAGWKACLPPVLGSQGLRRNSAKLFLLAFVRRNGSLKELIPFPESRNEHYGHKNHQNDGHDDEQIQALRQEIAHDVQIAG